ncbi:homeodomain-like protein, partial [Tanacetum coccineum]
TQWSIFTSLQRKEASTSGTTAVNQSSSNPFDEDEAYAHGEGSADEHDNSVVAQNATHYNYGTHLKKRRAMKWTKQDTELFYEAIQQFGTDLSMIKECCFPGRTREQIKSKYKKEERKQPLRLNDALTTRAGDFPSSRSSRFLTNQIRYGGNSRRRYPFSSQNFVTRLVNGVSDPEWLVTHFTLSEIQDVAILFRHKILSLDW